MAWPRPCREEHLDDPHVTALATDEEGRPARAVDGVVDRRARRDEHLDDFSVAVRTREPQRRLAGLARRIPQCGVGGEERGHRARVPAARLAEVATHRFAGDHQRRLGRSQSTFL